MAILREAIKFVQPSAVVAEARRIPGWRPVEFPEPPLPVFFEVDDFRGPRTGARRRNATVAAGVGAIREAWDRPRQPHETWPEPEGARAVKWPPQILRVVGHDWSPSCLQAYDTIECWSLAIARSSICRTRSFEMP